MRAPPPWGEVDSHRPARRRRRIHVNGKAAAMGTRGCEGAREEERTGTADRKAEGPDVDGGGGGDMTGVKRHVNSQRTGRQPVGICTVSPFSYHNNPTWAPALMPADDPPPPQLPPKG